MTNIRERVILRRALARGGVFAAAITSLILLLPLNASALTFHWIGGAAGNWNDPAEWDTIDAGGSEAAWPSTAGDIAIFPAAIASAVTVTIPTGVSAAFGELHVQTNFSVTIQRAGTGQIIVNTTSEADNGDISITGIGTHFISAPVRLDKHVTVQVANAAASVAFSGRHWSDGHTEFQQDGARRGQVHRRCQQHLYRYDHGSLRRARTADQ